MSARKATPGMVRLQAHLYAINAVQADRVGLKALAARMRRLANGASADHRPSEKEIAAND